MTASASPSITPCCTPTSPWLSGTRTTWKRCTAHRVSASWRRFRRGRPRGRALCTASRPARRMRCPATSATSCPTLGMSTVTSYARSTRPAPATKNKAQKACSPSSARTACTTSAACPSARTTRTVRWLPRPSVCAKRTQTCGRSWRRCRRAKSSRCTGRRHTHTHTCTCTHTTTHTDHRQAHTHTHTHNHITQHTSALAPCSQVQLESQPPLQCAGLNLIGLANRRLGRAHLDAGHAVLEVLIGVALHRGAQQLSDAGPSSFLGNVGAGPAHELERDVFVLVFGKESHGLVDCGHFLQGLYGLVDAGGAVKNITFGGAVRIRLVVGCDEETRVLLRAHNMGAQQRKQNAQGRMGVISRVVRQNDDDVRGNIEVKLKVRVVVRPVVRHLENVIVRGRRQAFHEGWRVRVRER
mmetsp:Transcript_25454/g.63872  ORF Transcript_25454/g.63872 Transcript_25454/m.63872 type:complete len:412 (-) Transcript_25454:300-1535(-)